MYPESITGSSFSVFAVSNMGRMAKLKIIWSFRAVFTIMDCRAGTLGLKLIELLWYHLQRNIPTSNVRSGMRESLEIEMVRG